MDHISKQKFQKKQNTKGSVASSKIHLYFSLYKENNDLSINKIGGQTIYLPFSPKTVQDINWVTEKSQ